MAPLSGFTPDKWVSKNWALGANGHRSKWGFGEMMGTMASGHLGIWKIWSKRTLGANKYRGTWAPGHMGTRRMAKEYSRQMNSEVNRDLGQIGLEKNEYLEQMGIWGKWTFGRKRWATPSSLKGYPKCPVSISSNVCIRALKRLGERGTLRGRTRYHNCSVPISKNFCK